MTTHGGLVDESNLRSMLMALPASQVDVALSALVSRFVSPRLTGWVNRDRPRQSRALIELRKLAEVAEAEGSVISPAVVMWCLQRDYALMARIDGEAQEFYLWAQAGQTTDARSLCRALKQFERWGWW